jgi:hypothetical protein
VGLGASESPSEVYDGFNRLLPATAQQPGTDGTFPSFSLNERTQKMGYVPSVPGLSVPGLS